MARHVVATGGLILLLASAAWAGPITLPAQSLLATPGVIVVDREDVTTVQFCDTIGWLAYKAPWLHAQVSAQDRRVLLLDVAAASGNASMAVWVQGQGTPLQLLIRTSGTTVTNHLYFVSCAGQPRQPAASAQIPQPTSGASAAGSGPTGPAPNATPAPAAPQKTSPGQSWDSFVSGLTARQWDLLKALISGPTAEAYGAFTASLSPQQAAAWTTLAPTAHLAPPPGTAAQPAMPSASQGASVPSWLVWQTQVASGGGDLMVPYTLTNTGVTEVVLDAARLRVLDATGTPLQGVSVSRQDSSGFEGRIAPGGLESGVIRIPATGSGAVVIRWPIVEVGTGKTYALTSQVEAAP